MNEIPQPQADIEKWFGLIYYFAFGSNGWVRSGLNALFMDRDKIEIITPVLENIAKRIGCEVADLSKQPIGDVVNAKQWYGNDQALFRKRVIALVGEDRVEFPLSS